MNHSQPNCTAQQHDELVRDTEEMLRTVSTYLRGELAITAEDYRLLETMNSASATKYAGMAQTAQELHVAMNELQNQYAALAPQLAQVEALSASVEQLEATANALDNYTAQLESEFEELDDDALRRAALALARDDDLADNNTDNNNNSNNKNNNNNNNSNKNDFDQAQTQNIQEKKDEEPDAAARPSEDESSPATNDAAQL